MKKDIKDFEKAIASAENMSREIQCFDAGNPEQKNQISDIVNDNMATAKVITELSDEAKVRDGFNLIADIDGKSEQGFSKLMAKIEADRSRARRRNMLYVLTSGVAAAVIFISFLVYTQTSKDELLRNNNKLVAETVVSNEIIEPVLITADGKRVLLSDIDNTDPSVSADFKSVSNSGMVYNASTDSVASMQYSSILMPNMRDYKVQLSDGTKVTICANSKLTYPISFYGDERVVELEGSAYFEVTKGTAPFKVRTRGVEVKVYGTQFNVDSYDEVVETALVSGSVGIKYDSQSEEIMLKPKQMASVNTKTGEHSVKDVNVNKVLAWQKGFFRYDSEPLVDLINELSNWYGVKFSYDKATVRGVTVNGSINRHTQIDKLLEIIEIGLSVKFVKKENIYYVESI